MERFHFSFLNRWVVYKNSRLLMIDFDKHQQLTTRTFPNYDSNFTIGWQLWTASAWRGEQHKHWNLRFCTGELQDCTLLGSSFLPELGVDSCSMVPAQVEQRNRHLIWGYRWTSNSSKDELFSKIYGSYRQISDMIRQFRWSRDNTGIRGTFYRPTGFCHENYDVLEDSHY